MPKVSVLMPVYNTREEYLREAIDSVLGQTFDDFEFLILNDCSPDENVRKTVLSYSDPRIVYAENEVNLGISGSRNRLVGMAKGDYLAVMDHDDVCMPERLEKQASFLDAHPDVGVLGTAHRMLRNDKIQTHPQGNEAIEKGLMYGCVVLHPSAMIRKSVLDENHLRYEEKYTPTEDYALWCRLLGKTCFGNLPDVLLEYRTHENNTSTLQNPKRLRAAAMVRDFARKSNPGIWLSIQDYEIRHICKIKIFGLPFFRLTTRRGETDNTVTTVYFFFIPFMKIKRSIKF